MKTRRNQETRRKKAPKAGSAAASLVASEATAAVRLRASHKLARAMVDAPARALVTTDGVAPCLFDALSDDDVLAILRTLRGHPCYCEETLLPFVLSCSRVREV